MSMISQQQHFLYPSQHDLVYEEELLRNPFNLKLWWRYLVAISESPCNKRFLIYERALRSLPGSYKLWHAYLHERLHLVRKLPVTHYGYATLNNTFERALVTMHKIPRVWLMYLQTLTEQKLVTRTRRTFDRALCALPVTQHDRIWEPYLVFAKQKGVPIETCLLVYRRYLKYDPSHVESFVDFLISSSLWQEAGERLASVLNDDQFSSIKGKTKHCLWLELCDLLTRHANEVSGLNVDAIIRGGIRKFNDEVGQLWTSLAGYYIRRGLHEKARDVFEEGMCSVTTVSDFSIIFDSYAEFELAYIEEIGLIDDEEKESDEEYGIEQDIRFKERLWEDDYEKRILHGFWLNEKDDRDLRFAQLEYLMERSEELAISVRLRQNPHNVEQWHRRVKLFDDNPAKQILIYAEAVRTIDPMKAVGKPHTLWIAFAKLYEHHNDLVNARVIFDKAVQVNFKSVDNLASIWCEWVEMEVKHMNFKGAFELIRRATSEPSVEVKRKVLVAADGKEPVQMMLHKSLRLWTLYVDLEQNLGTLESTCSAYERILDLRIATPQIIISYAELLQMHKYFEDAFKVYERGVKIFKYPHVKEIWLEYLDKFVKRYGKAKLERARELFENAVEMAPADQVKHLYLQYAKLEEEYGLAKRAMKVYDQATKAVPNNEKLSMYEDYIAFAAKIFGVPRTREIYEQAIEFGLPDKDAKTMCLRYAELEKSLGEIDRARRIYVHASQFADPRSDPEFWNKWREFEVQHRNEDTFREMLRIKRSVSASYSQIQPLLPDEYLMQKDQTMNLYKANDKSKKAGVPEDEMAALERHLASAVNNSVTKDRKVGFVSAGVYDGGTKTSANNVDIELQDESESDDEDDKIEIAQKDVPDAVFGGLTRKRADNGNNEQVDGAKENKLGALERIKRMKRN